MSPTFVCREVNGHSGEFTIRGATGVTVSMTVLTRTCKHKKTRNVKYSYPTRSVNIINVSTTRLSDPLKFGPNKGGKLRNVVTS